MGFLDQKERILDVVFTEYGRQLLAEQRFNVSYYAFGDSDVNYSGSVVFTGSKNNVSFDDFIHRGLCFEGDQRKGFNLDESKNLNSYLYTVPSTDKTLPNLRLSQTGTITLNRFHKFEYIDNLENVINSTNPPNFVSLRSEISKNIFDNVNDYLLSQRTKENG